MLDEVCAYLRNYFAVGEYESTYTIVDGALSLPFLSDGQYFRITGSVFNDGVYQYPTELHNETFHGTVTAMAVPADLVKVVADIKAWNEKYGNSVVKPFKAETFGKYSYTKDDSAGGVNSWQDAFKSKLKRWRKL